MSEPPHTIISGRTAFLLYAILLVISFLTLKGKFFTFAVIVVLALAAKSYIDHLRRKME